MKPAGRAAPIRTVEPAGKAVGAYSFDSGVDFSLSRTVYVAVWSALRIVVSYHLPDHAVFSYKKVGCPISC